MFQHEKSFQIAKEKWDKRKQRINKPNIVVVLWAETGVLTDEVLNAYNSIKYKKVLLTEDSVVAKDIVPTNYSDDWYKFKHFYKRYFEDYNWNAFFNK